MIFIALFILELFILYLLSRNIYILFFKLFYNLTRNKNITIHLLAFLFFTGTFLHEVAHWMMSKLLFVPVGSMTLIPKMNEKGRLRLGSVSIAKTDIIRRFLIGAAPVILGVSLILSTLYFAFSKDISNNYLVICLLGYLIFEIGNTMFSSKKDMEGALGLILTILTISAILYFLGDSINFHIGVSGIIKLLSHPILINIFQKATLYLSIPILIDLLFMLILKLLHKRIFSLHIN